MKRTEASIKPIYAQSWKCCLCDRKLFSFEAIPEVYSPKQECFCARCFVEHNPKLAKKIAGIVSKDERRSEEADEFLLITKNVMVAGGYVAFWAILGMFAYFIYVFFTGEPMNSENGMLFATSAMAVGLIINIAYSWKYKKSLFGE